MCAINDAVMVTHNVGVSELSEQVDLLHQQLLLLFCHTVIVHFFPNKHLHRDSRQLHTCTGNYREQGLSKLLFGKFAILSNKMTCTIIMLHRLKVTRVHDHLVKTSHKEVHVSVLLNLSKRLRRNVTVRKR